MNGNAPNTLFFSVGVHLSVYQSGRERALAEHWVVREWLKPIMNLLLVEEERTTPSESKIRP